MRRSGRRGLAARLARARLARARLARACQVVPASLELTAPPADEPRA